MGQQNRTRMAIAGTLQGMALMETIDDFDAPKLEFDMEAMRGGRFLEEEMAKGMKALSTKITLNGIGLPILSQMNLRIGDDVILQVREGGKDQNGNDYWTYHTSGGQLKALEEKTIKMGEKPVTVLEIANRTYTRVENGVEVVDIDARTQKLVFNGKDYMESVRRNVLMV
jgi:P2 family phage contractile tail tube protein